MAKFIKSLVKFCQNIFPHKLMKIIEYSSVYNVANNRVGPTEPALNGVTEL